MSSDSAPRQLVIFTLAGERYALPIEQVQEIIRYGDPRAVASTDPCVRGVISLRGRIVPVYDIAARLGLRSEVGEQSKIIIVEAAGAIAGVIVDSVEEVLTVSEAELTSAPTADATLIQAIVRIEERLVALLTLTGILHNAPELALAA